MTWLALAFALEVGFLPQAQLWNHQVSYKPYLIEDSSIYTELEARVTIAELLFIGGSVRTQSFRSDGKLNFSPVRDTYRFKAGLQYQGLEIGWRHMCEHPVTTNWQSISASDLGFERGYDELYIQFSGEVTIIGK